MEPQNRPFRPTNAGVAFAALGASFVATGVLVQQYPLLDPLANVSVTYLAGMLGFVVLLIGAHGVLFGCPVRELPLLPNLALFIVIGGAVNVNVVWEGLVIGYPTSDIWLELANSLEFALYYGVFLFLPRWVKSGKTRRSPNVCQTNQTPPAAEPAGRDVR